MPTKMPRMPPVPVSVMASKRNCQVMSRLRAPIALRTPISRVRSVTETSMMFITPIPPISRPMELSTTTTSATPPIMSLNCLHRFGVGLDGKVIGLIVGHISAATEHFASLVHGGVELPGIRENAQENFEARGKDFRERVDRESPHGDPHHSFRCRRLAFRTRRVTVKVGAVHQNLLCRAHRRWWAKSALATSSPMTTTLSRVIVFRFGEEAAGFHGFAGINFRIRSKSAAKFAALHFILLIADVVRRGPFVDRDGGLFYGRTKLLYGLAVCQRERFAVALFFWAAAGRGALIETPSPCGVDATGSDLVLDGGAKTFHQANYENDQHDSDGHA